MFSGMGRPGWGSGGYSSGTQSTNPPPPPPPTPAPGMPAPNFTNKTQISPYLKQHLQDYRDRLSSDVTERAIDRAVGGTMDAAALGAKDLEANIARRGAGGSGVAGAFFKRHAFDPAARTAAGLSADIAIGRERDLDKLILGGTDLMTSPDRIGLANRELALDQYTRTSELELEKQRLEDARRIAEIQSYNDLLKTIPLYW